MNKYLRILICIISFSSITQSLLGHEICKLVIDDLPQIMEQDKINIEDKIFRTLYSEEYFTRFAKEIVKNGKKCIGYVAKEKSSKILGWMICELPKKNSKKNLVCIVKISIEKSHRNQGLGKIMFNYLFENIIKPNKFSGIKLQVASQNLIAIKFYENLGFKCIKELEKYYNNGDNAKKMQLTIDN